MTPEKKILLWTVLAAITIMVFGGCATGKVESRKQKAEMGIPAALLPPGVAATPASRAERTFSDVGVAATVPPALPLCLMTGNWYPLSGEGGFTNTITTFWTTNTQCVVDNHCAFSTNLSYFLSCAVTIVNTNSYPWYGPTYAEHPEWFVWDSCHGHPHQGATFSTELFDRFGNLVRSNSNKGFCWYSEAWFFGTNSPLPSSCYSNVVQVGYGDTYHARTLCNGMDVTGLPDGEYTYVAKLDPLHRYGFYQSVAQQIYLTQSSVTKVTPLTITDLTNSVVLTWSAPGNYRVQISNDLTTWTTTESFVSSSPLVLPKNQPQQFFRLAMNP